MARFVYWPQGNPVSKHILNLKAPQAKSYLGVAVEGCGDDLYVVLLGDHGNGPPRGSAQLDFSKRKGDVVPVILTNVSQNDIVRVRHRETHWDWSEPLEINVAEATAPGTDRSKPEIRKSIVDLARTFVADAHYLWGSAGNFVTGNTPEDASGNKGGGNKVSAARLRAHSLDKNTLDQSKVLGVNMAVCTSDRYNTCAGRSSRGGVKVADLDAYIAARNAEIAAGKTDQRRWGGSPPGNFHPRKYHFLGEQKGSIVWGESCIGRRHFDCVGLVNYCYAWHWYKPKFGGDIKAFKEPNMGTFRVTNDNDRMDGDILIVAPDKHIGMLFQQDGKWFVVQATDTIYGLTDTSEYKPGDWERYRMNGAFLVPKKKVLD